MRKRGSEREKKLVVENERNTRGKKNKRKG